MPTATLKLTNLTPGDTYTLTFPDGHKVAFTVTVNTDTFDSYTVQDLTGKEHVIELEGDK